MRKKLPVIVIIIIFVLGICMLLYPTASNFISRITSTAAIDKYQSTVEEMDSEKCQAMLEAAQKYNLALTETTLYDPFGTNTSKLSDTYNELLNVNGIMGYVEIPKIRVYLPIYHGTSSEVLAKGIGHIEHTSLPIGGTNTHAVLSGHCGLPTSELFTNLDQLIRGNTFYIHVLGKTLAYQVDKISVVEPYEINELLITDEGDYVTLLTCTPYGINTKRLLVRGTRIAYSKEDAIQSGALHNSKDKAYMLPALIATGVVLFIILIWNICNYKKKKAKK